MLADTDCMKDQELIVSDSRFISLDKDKDGAVSIEELGMELNYQEDH